MDTLPDDQPRCPVYGIEMWKHFIYLNKNISKTVTRENELGLMAIHPPTLIMLTLALLAILFLFLLFKGWS